MNCNKCGKEIANIQTASCTNFVCKKCGSTEYEIKDKSNGTGIAHGLYCAKCGFWHKWLGKEELKQYATKESKDEIIAKLQSENAALRERLEKAITPEFKIYEDVYFIDYVNEKGYSEYTTGKPKIREAFITCVSQSTQTEFLYRLQPKDLPQEILNDSTIHDEWWDWRSFYAKEIFKTREAAEARLAELKGETE